MRRNAILVGLGLILWSATTHGADWPHVRGPALDGRTAGQGVLDSASALEVAWNVRLGSGYSGVAVASGRYSIEGLELTSEGPEGSGRASIDLSHADGRTRADLVFDRYDAGPLLAPLLPEGWEAGRANGKVAGEIGGALPLLTIDLALVSWRIGSEWPELHPVLRGGFDGRELSLDRIALGFEDEEAARLEGRLRIPFDPERPAQLLDGPVELHLACATTDVVRSLKRFDVDLGVSSTGPVRLTLDFAGQWRALTGSLEVTAADVLRHLPQRRPAS